MKNSDKKRLHDIFEPSTKHPLIRLVFIVALRLGGEARLVGGAVRDWLSGQPVDDIDMVVNLPIKKFAEQMAKEGIKIFETGYNHGTVTLYDAATKIEVTQTRVDLKTDGRHATVAYKRDWISDALRRDFTINAIYLDESGEIFDPLGGQEDLQKGRLRFVGDAKSRILEDALRIIRYCRLLPRFGWGSEDKQTQNVIKENANLCFDLSGERIASELRQIMVGNGVMQVIDAPVVQRAYDICAGFVLQRKHPRIVGERINETERVYAIVLVRNRGDFNIHVH